MRHLFVILLIGLCVISSSIEVKAENVQLLDGSARDSPNPPELIASANTSYSNLPSDITVNIQDNGGLLWRYKEYIGLEQKGQWIEATCSRDGTNAVGVQFHGDSNDGWASVQVDGREVWRGDTYGPADTGYVKYLEVTDLVPGLHTIRVVNLGITGAGGGTDVQVLYFGFRNARVEKPTTTTPTTQGMDSPPTGTTLVSEENSKLKWDRNGHYYEIVKKSMDWNEANSYAQSQQFIDPETGLVLKGHLATITSSEENAWIVQTLISPLNLVPMNGEWTATWLGGYRDEYATNGIGGWHWITGEPWAWTNWNQGQPDNCEGKERYLQMWANTGAPVGTWNDNDITGRRVINYILIEYEPTTDPINQEDIDKYNQIKQYVRGPTQQNVGPIQIQRIYQGAALYGAGVADTIQIDSNGNMVKAWEQPITGMEIALYGETSYAIRKSDEPPTAGDEAIVGLKGELGPAQIELTEGVEFSQKGKTNLVGSAGVGSGPVGASVSTSTEGWVGVGTIGIGAQIAGIIHTGEPIPKDTNSILDKIIFDIIYAVYGPTKPMQYDIGTRSDLTQPGK